MFAPMVATAAVPQFVDRAAAAGLTVITRSGSVEKPHILESTGNGVLTVDYDGDGWQDLYFVAAYRLPVDHSATDEHNVLYRNLGDGAFVDVTAAAGVGIRMYGHGGCVGDFDSDGLPDLYVTAYGPNVLYRNNGDGTFSDVTVRAGVADPRWSIGAVFFDADSDGDHDLFVANYIEATWEEVLSARRLRMWRGKVAVMDGPRGLPESANIYYRNRGDGTFEDATITAGFAEGGMGYSMGVVAFDWNNDGDLDVYVANDSTPNRLYDNRGDGTFEEIGTWTGAAFNANGLAQGSMGIGVGDYDGDGWLDLAVTNFAHDTYALYRNLGGELFQDDSFVAGVSVPSYVPLGWAALFLDADHDRDVDLFLANGHIYPQVDEVLDLGESYRQLNQLLLNDGGEFRDVSAEAGAAFTIVESSRGAAAVDVDNDGDRDIAVSNQDAPPTLLVNQLASPSHWLVVTLPGSESRSIPLGARAEVEVAGVRQVREIESGGSYASQNDLRPHFGLAESERVDRLMVRWPNGRHREYRDLPADRITILFEAAP